MRQLIPASDDVDLFAAYAQPRPGVRVNFVASVDGAATIDGRSDPLSSPADKRVFRVLRAMSDVVLVGAGTVRAEQYGPLTLPAELAAWRLSHGRPAVPTLAVVSASLDLDPSSELFFDAPVRPLILTGEDAPADRRAKLAEVAEVLVGDSVDAWLRLLTERGLSHVLCEGGPRLFGTLLAAGHVDELCLTVSPLLAGAPDRRIAEPPLPVGPLHLHLVHVLESDGFLFLRYATRPA